MALPSLYGQIIQGSANKRPISLPSLFELAASIKVHDSALKAASQRYHSELHLPEPDNLSEDPQVSRILKGVFDLEFKTPFIAQPIPLPATELAASILTSWIISACGILEASETFIDGRLPPDYLLKIVRALGFIHGTSPGRPCPDGLYTRCHSIFASLSLHERVCVPPLTVCALNPVFPAEW